MPSSSEGIQGQDAGKEAGGGAAAGGAPPAQDTAAEAAVSGAAAGEGGDGSCTQVYVVLSREAGTVFGVLEGALRFLGCDESQPKAAQSALVENAVDLARDCTLTPTGQPNLLLRLAQEGTQEQKVAFFNLLVTLLKVSGLPAFRRTVSNLTADAGSHCRLLVSTAAGMMLQPSAFVATAAFSAMDASSSSSSSSSSDRDTAGSSRDLSAAPWLLLLGRCYLRWAAELAQRQAEGADWAQLIKQARQQQQEQEGKAGWTPLLSYCFAGNPPVLPGFTGAVLSIINEGSSMSAGLTAAGYDLGAMRQGFEAVAGCYPGVLDTEGLGADAAGNVGSLISTLEAAGRACSVFAVPHCCNNPGCSNLAAAGELATVSGKSCICGGCQVARYCGRGCQKAHWKQHKPVCKMLQAANPQHS